MNRDWVLLSMLAAMVAGLVFLASECVGEHRKRRACELSGGLWLRSDVSEYCVDPSALRRR